MSRIHRCYRLGILLIVLTIFCWSSSIFTQLYRSGTSFSSPSSATTDESWELIWDDDFKIQYMWGDESHLFTAAQNLRQRRYYTNEMRIQKWDFHGNSIKNYTWDHQAESAKFVGMWGNNESIFISGNQFEEVTESEEQINVSSGFIMKFNKNLTLQWNCTWNWNDSQNSTFTDIWCNDQYIFTSGFTSIDNASFGYSLLQWNMNGDLIWNTTFNRYEVSYYYGNYWQNYYDYYGRRIVPRIMGNSDSVYTYYTKRGSGYSNNFEYLVKRNLDGTNLWNNISSIGSVSSRICEIWVEEDYTITFIESIGDDGMWGEYKWLSKVRKRDIDGNLLWDDLSGNSAFYWNNYDGYTYDGPVPLLGIWGNDTGIYLCTDILRDKPLQPADLYLFHFNENGTHQWHSIWNWHRHDIYIWNILLWGNDQFLFSGGQIYDLDSGKELNFLIKWDREPAKSNIPIIIGVSIGASTLIVVVTLWLVIKPIRRLKRVKLTKENVGRSFQYFK